MDLFNIDQQSCDQDGLCAAVCPAGLIDFDKKTFPKPVADADERCIRCGHCVSVCPNGSLSHRDMPVADCVPVEQQFLLNAEQCDQFLTNRRSIRNFRQKPVSEQTLQHLIEVARYGPTGHNSQGVEWLVLGGKEELHRLCEIVAEWMRFMLDKMPEFALALHMDRTIERWEQGDNVILRGAPSVVVAHMEKDNRMAPPSCTIALTYLELAATGMGLGCCWDGYFNAAASTFPPMKEVLALPDGHQSFGSMMVGYPKFRYNRIPLRKSPKITW